TYPCSRPNGSAPPSNSASTNASTSTASTPRPLRTTRASWCRLHVGSGGQSPAPYGPNCWQRSASNSGPPRPTTSHPHPPHRAAATSRPQSTTAPVTPVRCSRR
ncbi:uncharacterized protein PD653_4724, partial [Nocardioides sp. PD653]